MPLPCQKHLFALDSGVHYLNGAAYSPSLRSSVDAGIAGLRLKAETPYKLRPGHHFDAGNRIRGLFSELVHAGDPDRIALIPAVSYGMAVVAQNLHRWPGMIKKKNIVLIGEEFPNNVYAFERVLASYRIKTKTIERPIATQDQGAHWNEQLLQAITTDTALVVASAVHWIYGTVFDLKAIGERCKEVGAMFVIDGTQSVGILPFDVQAIKPDALICAAYKWLLGPYSTGVAYFGPFFDDGVPVEESWMNREESDQFAQLIQYKRAYRPKAQRYNAGEFSQFSQLPMLEASLKQILDWGVTEMQAYCRSLSEPAILDWEKMGCALEAPAHRAGHLFGMQLPGRLDYKALVERLAEQQIYISLRGGSLRISPNVYNDSADLAALTAVLQTV